MEEKKEAKLTFNKEEEGNIEAVFSVFNMIDSDGDVVVKGAVKSGFPKSGNVPMVWSHDWKQPIGKGIIDQDDNKATFKGKFFMDTEAGQEAYKLVKNMGDLQQWSFGYEVNEYENGEFKDNKGEEQNVRYLKDLSVFEVSPVLVGANRETYTLAMKHALQQEGELKDEIKQEDIEKMLDEKAALGKDTYDNPGEAMEASKKMSCEIGVHTHEVDGKDVFMPCKTHEEYEKAIGDKPMEQDDHYPDHEEDGYGMDDDKKGHTPVHTVQQSVGQIAEDLKDIMGKLPKDIDAPLPSWWVDGMKMIAKKANMYRDYLVDPKFMEMDPKGWGDDKKGLKDDNQMESTVLSRTFAEHVESLIDEVNEFKQRVMSLALLRAEKGKRLGKSASDGVATVANALEDTFRDLDDLLNEGDTPIVEAEVEVEEEIIEVVEDVVEAEAMPDVSNDVEVTEGESLEEQVAEVTTDDAMNQLFLDTQSALARTLGVEINTSDEINIDGDIENNG